MASDGLEFRRRLRLNPNPDIGGRYDSLEIGEWRVAVIGDREDEPASATFSVAVLKKGEERFRSPWSDPALAVPGVDWSRWEMDGVWPMWFRAPAAAVQALVDHLENKVSP